METLVKNLIHSFPRYCSPILEFFPIQLQSGNGKINNKGFLFFTQELQNAGYYILVIVKVMCIIINLNLGKCVSQVGEHITQGISVSKAGEHITLGKLCVSQVGEQITTRDMCSPHGGTQNTRNRIIIVRL